MAKSCLHTIYQKLAVVWRWLVRLSKRDGSPKTNDMPPYKHCMNCGEELVGMFCHKCGQYASVPAMKMFGFVRQYIRELFSIESQAIPTLVNLIFHPGRVAKEFNAGRYVSYVNPLKLNIFILVVLITIFSIVGTDEKVKGSFKDFTDKQAFVSSMSLSSIAGNESYIAKAEGSPRKTITLVSSQTVVEDHPQLVEVVEVVSASNYHLSDTLVVSVPAVFIEDKLLVEENGVYHFVKEESVNEDWLIISQMTTLWEKIMSLVFAHFPLFMLLTTPFFVFPLRLLLRKRNYSLSNLYIFSLYYIAFVELLLTTLFICGVIFDFSAGSVSWFLRIGLLLYLAAALRTAYDIKPWLRAIFYAVVINAMYFTTALLTVMVVSFIALVAMVVMVI